MATLNKFGVPYGGGAGRGNVLQPKQKHKFRIRFINFGPIAGGLELTANIMSCDRPKNKFGAQSIKSYNSTLHYIGRSEWDPINVSLIDDVTNSTMRLVQHQNQKQFNHFEQTSFLAGINYKFTTIIEVLDGGNDGVLEQWTLEGCYIDGVDPEGLGYDGDDGLKISFSIVYDNATLSDGIMPTASGSGGLLGGGLGFINGFKLS